MEYILKSDNALKKLENIRSFLLSDKWLFILFAITGIFACLSSIFPYNQIQICGTVVLAYITGVTFVLTGDLMAMLTPTLFTYLIALRCYNSLAIFMKIKWLVIPLIIMLLFNLIAYRTKLTTKGSQFKPMMLVSFAVMLGGVGFISPKEYFAGSSIYHMLGMGFGMVLAYCFFYSKIELKRDYSLIDRLTKVMVVVGLFASFMIVAHYIVYLNEFLDRRGLFFIRWRNNCSTIMMITMPFAFLRGNKKSYATIFGFIIYASMLLTGSRGGMVFGSIELVMCIVMFILYDKRRRLAYAIICICVLFGLLVYYPQIAEFLSYTVKRLFKVLNDFLIGGPDTETRVRHYARGVEDFLNHPIFGTGLGYMGNRDIFQNKAGALCWYHCEPIQIAASFGVIGIVTFIYQFIKRNALIWKKATLFNMTIFLSYISLEMMSLVNPGILCPMPYLMLVTLFMVIVEKCDDSEPQEKIPIFRRFRKFLKNRHKA